MDSLIAKLGLNKSEFSAKLKEATTEATTFEKGWSSVGKIFAAGGITTAVVGFFKQVIDSAQAARGPLDENTAAVKRFGDSIDEAKAKGVSFGTVVLGSLNRMGEALGTLAKFSWKSLFGEGGDYAAAEAMVASTGKAAEAAERALSAARKHASEFSAITAALKKTEEDRAVLQLKNLTDQERLNKLTNDYSDLRQQQSEFEGTALERRQLQLAVAKAGLALETEMATLAKKTADERAKIAADEAKTRERMEQKMRLSNEDELRMSELQQKAQQNLTASEREQLETLKLKTEEKRIEVELSTLLEKGIKNLNPEEKKRLDKLLEQKTALDEQVKLKDALAKAADGQAASEKTVTEQLVQQTNELLKQAGIGIGPGNAVNPGAAGSATTPAEYDVLIAKAEQTVLDATLNLSHASRGPAAAAAQEAYVKAQVALDALRDKRGEVNVVGPGFNSGYGLPAGGFSPAGFSMPPDSPPAPTPQPDPEVKKATVAVAAGVAAIAKAVGATPAPAPAPAPYSSGVLYY